MKSILWKLMVVSGVAVMALGLSGCSGSSDDDSMEEEVSAPDTVVEETTAPEPMTYTLGEFFTTQFEADSGRDNYEMVLNSVVDGWRYPAGALGGSVSPSEGMKLVVANVSVSELGEGLANVALNDFTLVAGGENYKYTWFLAGHGLSEFPNLLTVNGGETATHDIVFEVPADTDLTGATLNYADVVAQEESAMSFTIQ